MIKTILFYAVLPAVASAAAVGLLMAHTSSADAAEVARPFFMTVAALSGTLMGFTMTCLSILVTFGDAEVINNLKKTGHYVNVIQHIYITAAGFFVSMVAGVASLLWMNDWVHLFACFFFVFSLLSLLDTGRKFYKVVDIIGKPTGNPHKLD